MSNKVFLTAEALNKLKEELNYLKTDRRKEIAAKIYKAKEQGDLSENAEYSEAKDDQAFLEGKIAEIEEKIKNAEVVDKSNNDQVSLGCSIKVLDQDQKQFSFTVVSFNESDPASGKISNESPLGSAFLGRKAGEEIEVSLPVGVRKFKIVEINC